MSHFYIIQLLLNFFLLKHILQLILGLSKKIEFFCGGKFLSYSLIKSCFFYELLRIIHLNFLTKKKDLHLFLLQ